jgi:steroid delta-isomerase-like uncharacterized protein
MKKLPVIISLVLLLCFGISCQDKAQKAELEKFQAQAKIEEQNKELARRFLEEAWGKSNQDVVDELLAENFVLHNPPQDVAPDKEGYKQWVSMSTAAFTTVESRVEDIIAEGDIVVTRWTYLSTHEAEFMGIPPTGKQITMTGISIDRFEDGKIVEEWIEMDQFGMMKQLGMELKPREGDK